MQGAPVFLSAAELAQLRVGDFILDQLRRDADKIVAGDPFTITTKSRTPPSGDKRDYSSMGPYWWPNPGTPTGLPYIRRDGEVNPETLHTDRQTLEACTAAVETLAVAWNLTGERRYALCAAELLHAFFVDEKTRMNPNLNFGQAVPGHCEGRGIGIIDTRQLPALIDHVRLLAPAGTVDETNLRAWFKDFGRWLRESPLGIDEANEHNNHGTWYDVQVAAFALYANELDIARDVLNRVTARRIATQIAPDGSQPHEIARTLGLGYSTMNLHAFFWLASLGERVGINLWHAGSGGRSIKNALDFLTPFWLNPQQWASPQIKPFDPADALPLLLTAARVYDPTYREIAGRLPPPTSKN